MNIYVTTKFENREEAREVMRLLEERGHTITLDWTTHEIPKPGDKERWAVDDLQGVADADLIFLILPGGSGAHTELGAGLILGKRVIIVGEKLHSVFHYHPNVTWCRTKEEAIYHYMRPWNRVEKA